jgi:flavin-binding protein dodecin
LTDLSSRTQRLGKEQHTSEAGVSEPKRERRRAMPDSIYKVVQLVGTSSVSWEDAAKRVVDVASQSLRDLRVAEIVQLDLKIEDGKVVAYRAKVNLSFKFEAGK